VVAGIAAIVIGLAEGYSIMAIVRALSRGTAVTRAGRTLTRSPPKVIVFSTRALMLAAWLGFFWDSIVSLFYLLISEFPTLNLPNIQIPRVFETLLAYVLNIFHSLSSYAIIFLPLAVLIIPLYVIIISAFKFFSISLVLETSEKARKDTNVFFLLISSAFVLITTNILEDISTIPVGEAHQYLPLEFATAQWLIPWAIKVLDALESFAFYVGFGIGIIIGMKKLRQYLKDRSLEKAEKKLQELTTQKPELPTEPNNNN
jgi:hypothetical protein